ncbi:ABC transporter substrate-binding protein [Frankia gtarii]|uniref:ABC transporter substrate-binding protein n=1 Tax=Frankia gtarii TaxID=2950102 RepID=UPI0021C16A68|nr:ABC transporter substrate-binding protein [Frankia gtarii]
MTFTIRSKIGLAGAVATLMAVAACGSSSSSSSSGGGSATGQSGGVSGGASSTTIKVAGIGPLAQFGDAAVGAQARFKRFNDTNEVPGVKIDFSEFADDKGDPATATSEVRRLVNAERVFAIVPDMSAVNPGPFLAAQKVLYVGGGYDDSYCTDKPSTSLWGFGIYGCWVPASPQVIPDTYARAYKYLSAKAGTPHPSLVLVSDDSQAGKNVARFQASAAEGAGFTVVDARGNVPTVTSDFTPYVQKWLSANRGKQPDVITCALTTQCLPIYDAVKAAGFRGAFQTPLGPVDLLAKPLAGSYTFAFYNTDTSPGLTQLKADLQAFKSGTAAVGYSNVPAYFAADMFVQALKKVKGKPTREAVQHALATQTWEIPGLVGPTTYPASTVAPTPSCSQFLQAKPDGSGFASLGTYACSTKQYKINPRFTG